MNCFPIIKKPKPTSPVTITLSLHAGISFVVKASLLMPFLISAAIAGINIVTGSVAIEEYILKIVIEIE